MATFSVVDNLWELFLEALFPVECVGCGKVGELVCAGCLGDISPSLYQICPECGRSSAGGAVHSSCETRYSLSHLLFLYRYRPPLSTALAKIKYDGFLYFRPFPATLFAQGLANIAAFVPNDLLVCPVPLHPSRLRERGFNLSLDLANNAAPYFRLQGPYELLHRVNNTPRLSLEDNSQRRQILKGAFKINESLAATVIGRRVILVDDVYTTGSTLKECSRTLIKAGATEVWGLCLAHG